MNVGLRLLDLPPDRLDFLLDLGEATLLILFDMAPVRQQGLKLEVETWHLSPDYFFLATLPPPF
jgi:hypothetical protein